MRFNLSLKTLPVLWRIDGWGGPKEQMLVDFVGYDPETESCNKSRKKWIDLRKT